MIDQLQPEIQEEYREHRAAEKSYEAEQVAKAQSAQAARDLILDPVRARLAAGAVSRNRLQIITGLSEPELKDLLEFGHIQRGWNANTQNESEQALSDLAQWLKEDEHPAEDDSGYAVTPTFQQLQNLFAHAHLARSLLAITGA